MCKMLFPKSGCDYLSAVYFPKKPPPFQRELLSKEGESSGLPKVCCGGPILSRLSVSTPGQPSPAFLPAAPLYCGLLVLSAGQGQGLAGPGGDKSGEWWHLPCVHELPVQQIAHRYFREQNICVPVLLKGRQRRKRKLTEQERKRKKGTFLRKINLFTFFPDTYTAHHLNHSVYLLSYLLEKLYN